MNRRSLARLALVASFAPLTACPGGGGTTSDTAGGECAAGLVGGELVLTEFLPDPPGKDGDGIEWFELYNATTAPISLNGVGLVYSKVDGSDPEGHLIMDGGLEIAPGAYMTFGKVTDAARPPHVDFGYGSDLGEMSNSGGRLSVMCGGTLIDKVDYDASKVKEGQTAIFDGNVPPTAEGNDDLTLWCATPVDGEPYYTSEFGSPRAQNAGCPLAMPDTCAQCYEGESLRDAVAPQPGQLVITEVMPNASALTEDSVGEWFELAVTDGTFDLNCLQYGANTAKFAEDPASAELVHVPQCMTVTAGDVLLFSQKQWTETDFVAKITLSDNKSATNPDPGVFIAHDGVILDEIHYPTPKDGVAFSLDPQWTTVAGNDDFAHFCAASTSFAEGDLGTPGAANPVCLANPCQDGDTVREAVAPTPGQVFITEVHANVSTDIGEPAGEWIEFLATAPFDLNGLQLGKSAADIDFTFAGDVCLPVGPGLVLLARDGEPGKLLEPAATYTTLQLSNTDGALWVGVGGVELDAMPYETPKDGVARQVDAAIVDAFMLGDVKVDANDPPASRCDAVTPYAPFNLDLGTPGAANVACEGPPPEGCVDPDTMAARPIVSPTAGQLLITEYMANPKQAGDATAEWFELFADADVDLNGLEIGKVIDPYTVIETVPAAGPCIEVKAGQFVLLARSADPALNGMLPAPTVVLTKLSLTNTAGSLFVGLAGQVLDHLAYTTTVEAKATQLKPELVTPGAIDTAANDVELNLCAATALYNMVDAGTPGAANTMCGGGMGGDTCFDAAMMMDRPIVSPAPGDLVITEFLADPTIVADTAGEWFEVLANAPVDLNLVKVLAKAAPTMDEVTAAKALGAGPNCIHVDAGGRALVARNADAMLNGGLPPVDAVTTINLGNTAGAISLHAAGVLLDAVAWVKTKSPGKSTQLGPGVVDPAMNDDADVAPWCTAADAGTPKQENVACP